jgi:hypothetical protein
VYVAPHGVYEHVAVANVTAVTSIRLLIRGNHSAQIMLTGTNLPLGLDKFYEVRISSFTFQNCHVGPGADRELAR